jgi:chromosome segregation ATPase
MNRKDLESEIEELKEELHFAEGRREDAEIDIENFEHRLDELLNELADLEYDEDYED